MKALILAAGRGRRMALQTENSHKSLTSLLNKPILEWQLEALKIAGVEKTVVITGYQKEKVLPYFDTHFHNNQWSSTNMAYTLLQANSLLTQEEVLICYSDIVYHPSIIKALMNSKLPIAITYDVWWEKLWSDRFTNPLDDAESFKCNCSNLLEIGQKAHSISDIEGQYMGLIKLHPKQWKEMKPLITPLISLTEILSQLLLNNIAIEAIPIKGQWCEIDHINDLTLYEKKLTSPLRWSHDFRWDY